MLRLGALVRRFRRSLGTWQGLSFLALAVGIIGIWLAPLIVVPLVKDDPLFQVTPEWLRAIVPVALLAACVMTVLLGEDKAIRFVPAEVDFLFPAPFTRRELVLYKLGENIVGAGAAGLFFFVWLVPYMPVPLACLLGAFLSLLFIQLFQIVTVLLFEMAGAKLASMNRGWAVGAVIVLLAVMSVPAIEVWRSPNPLETWNAFRATTFGQIVFAPFNVFANLVTAEQLFPDVLIWGTLAAAINGSLIGLIFLLDEYYMEAALASSQRFAQMIARIQQGGVLSAWGTPLRWKTPRPPRLWGAGAIIWRQTTHAMRSLPTMLSLGGVIVFVMVAPTVFVGRNKSDVIDTALFGVTAAVVQLTAVFTMMLRFDFRGDLDQMDWLKMLPVSSWAIAVGQLVVPVAMATLVQTTLLGGLAIGYPEYSTGLLIVAAFTVPLNVYLFALENTLFLVYPSRSVVFNPGDLQGFGQQVILFAVKMFLLFFGVAAAGILGGVGY
ncbi:MAG TPA: putative ABC exporter domain-containing protein, partial [Pirellulales bacterium]